MDAVRADSSIRVLIIGSEENFTAGADIKEMMDMGPAAPFLLDARVPHQNCATLPMISFMISVVPPPMLRIRESR